MYVWVAVFYAIKGAKLIAKLSSLLYGRVRELKV
jgi:hypothetical protein